MPIPAKQIHKLVSDGNQKAFVVPKGDEEGSRLLVFADNEGTSEFKRVISGMCNLRAYLQMVHEKNEAIDTSITQ